MAKKTKQDYPKNWQEISERIKKRDNYTCQGCKLSFVHLKGKSVRVIMLQNGLIRRLTVHHKDRKPMNCKDGNLISLCCACHCREEWPLIRAEMAKKQTLLQIEAGQQLFDWSTK